MLFSDLETTYAHLYLSCHAEIISPPHFKQSLCSSFKEGNQLPCSQICLEYREASYRIHQGWLIPLSLSIILEKHEVTLQSVWCITSLSPHMKDDHSYRVLDNWHFKYSNNFIVVWVGKRKSETSSFYKEKCRSYGWDIWNTLPHIETTAS